MSLVGFTMLTLGGDPKWKRGPSSNASEHRCATCGALPGQFCRAPNGRNSRAHKARLEAAAKGTP